MSPYSKYIFPRILDKIMSRPVFQSKRREVLTDASGEVLEIGLGTGLNLSEYPSEIKKITTVDTSPGMNAYAQKRAAAAGKIIEHHVITAEKLPFADATFDTVVSTWTLCSIPNPEQAVREVYRVLKPGGKFIFIEHGLAKTRAIQRWQNFCTPIWKRCTEGCHLNRDVKKIISTQPFTLSKYQEFCAPKMIALATQMYQGVGVKK